MVPYFGVTLVSGCLTNAILLLFGAKFIFRSPPCVFGEIFCSQREFPICVAWPKAAGSFTFHLLSFSLSLSLSGTFCQNELLLRSFAACYTANKSHKQHYNATINVFLLCLTSVIGVFVSLAFGVCVSFDCRRQFKRKQFAVCTHMMRDHITECTQFIPIRLTKTIE